MNGCEDSYIGLADFFKEFFSGKNLKYCSRLIFNFSRFDLQFFFEVSAFLLLKGIEQQNCKGHEKCDRLLISKMKINYQISQ